MILNCIKFDVGPTLEALTEKNGFTKERDFIKALSNTITVEVSHVVGEVTYIDIYKDGEFKETYHWYDDNIHVGE
jgi:hypothetical protein